MKQQTDNQLHIANVAARTKQLIEALSIKQKEFAASIKTDTGTISKILAGKLQVGPNLEYKILNAFNVNAHWWKTGEGEMFNPAPGNSSVKLIEGESLNYENLTFISTKSRVNFMESLSVMAEFETFEALKLNPTESYAGQIIFEIDGDSMEPYYCDGAKIRCQEVPADDWEFLLSGVYAVAYGNFFAIKRVKNSPVNGILALHSDNSTTSGTTEIPLSKIRKVWQALRIVDAPIR
ncbi:hypothetical protein [Dyadobacter sp. OTU695]|uniref:hypothetical protein n=1 Tax=Dyadobacter sp. OTU695 TaxID=3043860 RepID=UPI00313CFE3D